MNIILWVVQVLLAIAFIGAGFMKVSQPIDKLAKNMSWVTHTTPPIVKLIGVVEILGGLGLLLPGLTHILPILTAIAAVGLVLTMLGAAIVHVRLKEMLALTTPIILLLLSLFIVIGRFAIVPLS